MRRIARPTALLLLAACLALPAAFAAPDPAGSSAPLAASVVGAMDRKADPCQDFYRYACGGWIDATKIPSDRPIWGRGFSTIGERNLTVERELLEAAAKGSDASLGKAGTFYSACMDEATIDKRGIEPLKALLDDVATVKDAAGFLRLSGTIHRLGGGSGFGAYREPDFKNPDVNIAQFSQGGLGLPDRDYYLKDDEKTKDIRARYLDHVTKNFVLAGESQADASRHAAAVVGFETALAKVSRARADMRDPDKTYNKLDLAGLKKLTPALDWDGYLKAIGYPALTQINVTVPEFFQGLEKQLQATPAETLQAYLRAHMIGAAANHLSKPFVDEAFAFTSAITGQKENNPRWKRCVGATDGLLGDILARAYVEKQFPGDSKTIARDMIVRVEAAFASGLPQLGWMDDATRERARGKLGTLVNKIGYPDKWIDYSDVSVKPGQHFENLLSAQAAEHRREWAKIGNKVDKTEWDMTAPTVNAYYNPLANEMVFPAGILQPPFFDRAFPAALNFGGMGMVMGHELTHGYDDEGRKFDSTGKLSEWWAPEVSGKFEKQAACIEQLYNTYEVQPGVKLNGKLTLGENIADFGGIKTSYRAYRQWLKEHPSEKSPVEGLSNEQLFFVGFAQTWCTLATPEIQRLLVTVDPHSAPRFRVNGPLSNLPEFAEAFSCKTGAPMRAANACTVW